MSRSGRAKLAWWLAAAAALAIAGASVFMIFDQLAARRRAPAEAALIETLEERVKTDAEAAAELEAERERQTRVSLARETRNRRLSWVLLVATGVFLGAVNWRQALVGEPRPALEPLVRITGLSESYGEKSLLIPQPGAPLFQGRGSEGEAEELDLDFVDAIVDREGRGREAAIPILQAVQAHYRYLPEAALRRVCELTEVSPAQVAGLASFYAQFRRTPMGRHLVRVCHGTACHVAGIGPIMDELRRRLAIPPGSDTDPRRLFTLDPVACLGCCSLAPVMMIDDDVAGHLTPVAACDALATVEGAAG